MTKIDESKQYKFSEIIAMLENKELAYKGVVISREEAIRDKNSPGNVRYKNKSLKIMRNGLNELGLIDVDEMATVQTAISVNDINSLWSIKLPKEDKFYLKAPDCFMKGKFLNWDCRKDVDKYFFAGTEENWTITTRFTQKEIASMPFDTKFFEKVKVEEQ